MEEECCAAKELAQLSTNAMQQFFVAIQQLQVELVAATELNKKLSVRCEAALQQRDQMQRQLAAAEGKTSAVLHEMRAKTPSTDIAASIQVNEVQELLDLVGDEEEARELCKEVGLSLDAGLSIETMKAALKGHYNPDATVDEVFAEMDADGSGYLDEEEVQARARHQNCINSKICWSRSPIQKTERTL